MKLPEIGRVNDDGMFVPTDDWNIFFNYNRKLDPHYSVTAAHEIGTFVASQVIEHTTGHKYWDSADAFVGATQPPMSDGERMSFLGAFTKMDSVRGISQQLQPEL